MHLLILPCRDLLILVLQTRFSNSAREISMVSRRDFVRILLLISNFHVLKTTIQSSIHPVPKIQREKIHTSRFSYKFNILMSNTPQRKDKTQRTLADSSLYMFTFSLICAIWLSACARLAILFTALIVEVALRPTITGFSHYQHIHPSPMTLTQLFRVKRLLDMRQEIRRTTIGPRRVRNEMRLSIRQPLTTNVIDIVTTQIDKTKNKKYTPCAQAPRPQSGAAPDPPSNTSSQTPWPSPTHSASTRAAQTCNPPR